MYADDSFFTLTLIERTGLVLISLALAAVCFWTSSRLGRQRHLLVRIVLAFAVFYLFVWLSPQVYYTYYLFLFDGLPLQSVIKSPPGPIRLFRLLTFQDNFNLSYHSRAVFGWVLLALAVFQPSLPARWRA